MKFKNVLLASDFDGTLADCNGIIPESVISAIKYFMSEGGRFTVCTGRIFQGFHLYSEEYINAPVLLGNGAMAYDYKNKDADWKNSKDAIQRGMQKLRGSDPSLPPHVLKK